MSKVRLTLIPTIIVTVGKALAGYVVHKTCMNCYNSFLPGQYKAVPDLPLMKLFTAETKIQVGEILCPDCYDKYISPCEMRFNIIKDTYKSMPIFDIGRKCDLEITQNNRKFLISEYLGQKSDALEQLKLIAGYEYCDAIVDFEYDLITAESGFLWAARGYGTYFVSKQERLGPEFLPADD